ncbi:hypothetical protein N7509_004791 [Penicillium cosmopolitanum]|uniref:Uncharacterized protein n=1 Tax=Penicillium cosmopolitanum TaxID=1131564 RepID=A0A9X0B9F6_9EURO|nr:uncharacterized protein N7509_004791 [Penicillium cosmopolitanum]KAJ5396678.1 hypothetical protein N7509_004791 [Penicillium cosmopolitanum]
MTLENPTNTDRPTPTITPESASLHLGSSIFINAPSTRSLTDTSTWPSWNSFVPRVTIRSQPDTPTSTSADTDPNTSTTAPAPLSPILQKGTKVTFHVRMDPNSTKPQPATDAGLIVTEYEAPNAETGTAGRIVWASDFEAAGTMPPSLLTAERVHEIKDVKAEEGGVSGTEVRNWELQVGWLVYVVKWMYGAQLRVNFDLWVNDLKGFVEGNGGGHE